MAKLRWDEIGERLYEAGLDRGVLYLEDDTGIPWNGLTSVEENASEDTSEPRYFDGVKYLDQPYIGNFSATLRALTYPDEFLEYEGVEEIDTGLSVDGQAHKQFGLSYRTRVGNDVDNTDHGYKIHLLYNLVAISEVKSYTTMQNPALMIEFGWSIAGTPVVVEEYRPTAHVILDSRYLPVDVLAEIERILYGSDGYFPGEVVYDGRYAPDEPRDVIDGGHAGSVMEELPGTENIVTGDPRLPSIAELIDLTTLWGPRIIVPNETTGFAALVAGVGDITATNVPGVFTVLPDTRLNALAGGYYELVP